MDDAMGYIDRRGFAKCVLMTCLAFPLLDREIKFDCFFAAIVSQSGSASQIITSVPMLKTLYQKISDYTPLEAFKTHIQPATKVASSSHSIVTSPFCYNPWSSWTKSITFTSSHFIMASSIICSVCAFVPPRAPTASLSAWPWVTLLDPDNEP